jgi:hypothetical protein
VAVGRGALNLKSVGGRDKGFAFEDAAQGVDLSSGPRGEIGEGALHNLAVDPGGFSEEDGRRGIPIGDGLDIHGIIIP